MSIVIEKPVTTNTAILYNEKHSRFDALAEEKRLAIVNAPNSEYAVSGTTYYVSPNGNDEADGTSPETAWRTLANVRDPERFVEGDAVLFERGGVYRGNVFVGSGMTFAAYGEGPKPCIYGSLWNYADPSLWQPTDTPNVWQIAIDEREDVGNLVFDHGVACGIKELTNDLAADHHFYFADGTLYLYLAAGNPAEVYTDIEICGSAHVFRGKGQHIHDVTFENLCVKYGGKHGICFANGAENITVRYCEIGYLGGCMMIYRPSPDVEQPVRFGNGFEVVDNCSHITVEDCWVYQCYDAGITHQSGYPLGCVQEHIRFADNLIEYCPYNIELYTNWQNGTISHSVYENNILRFAGYGFGTVNRFGSNTSVVSHICAYYRAQPCEDFVIRNNIMDTSYRYMTAIAYPNDPQDRGPTIVRNTYVQSHFANGDTVAGVALLEDKYAEPSFKTVLPAGSQAEMEESVAKIDLAPAAVYYDE